MERKEETVLSVKDLQYGLTFHMDKFWLANMMSRKRSTSNTLVVWVASRSRSEKV